MFPLSVIIVCACFGLAVGALSGLLGIGGGVLIVPFIILFLGDRIADANLVPTAVATSLACIFLTTLSVASTQVRHRAVHWGVLKVWAVPMTLGSFAASQLAGLADSRYLLFIVAVLLIFTGILMLARRLPKSSNPLPGRLKAGMIALLIGLFSGICGIGGGNMVVPTLSYFKIPILQATATAGTLAVPMSLAAAAGFVWAGQSQPDLPEWSLGFVYLPAVLGIASGSMLAAPLGVALAHRLPTVRLRQVFAVFLIAISSTFAWQAFHE